MSEILAGDALELWVLADEADVPIGFLGLAGDAVEALFLEPDTVAAAAAGNWWRTRRRSGAAC